jgi:hypothetical protein
MSREDGGDELAVTFDLAYLHDLGEAADDLHPATGLTGLVGCDAPWEFGTTVMDVNAKPLSVSFQP